eukprot:scaffold2404_cov398-Prasinococcus_capsulatus_cf.AAC.35
MSHTQRKCEPGTSRSSQGICEQCAPGNYAWNWEGKCRPCAPGRVAPQEKATFCRMCPKGWYAGSQNGTTHRAYVYEKQEGGTKCHRCAGLARFRQFALAGAETPDQCVPVTVNSETNADLQVALRNAISMP